MDANSFGAKIILAVLFTSTSSSGCGIFNSTRSLNRALRSIESSGDTNLFLNKVKVSSYHLRIVISLLKTIVHQTQYNSEVFNYLEASIIK